jgi:hypothetical protein
MVRSYTRRIITLVADVNTLRNRPVCELITQTMGKDNSLSLFRRSVYSSVAMRPPIAYPYPTLSTLVYLIPESFFEGIVWVSVSAGLAYDNHWVLFLYCKWLQVRVITRRSTVKEVVK